MQWYVVACLELLAAEVWLSQYAEMEGSRQKAVAFDAALGGREEEMYEEQLKGGLDASRRWRRLHRNRAGLSLLVMEVVVMHMVGTVHA
eukprot:CAMPEP_0172664686 /NCGR_PEP_ID=MMETSP1074-20121228/6768_1 /TAXON_ID=2916 /ORGANISM="Ceratium fusus, Strain PA161109" /LENGTH=88 /DNA_ID=CAMNT_0013480887 /DNA_START=97 /DNA_END=364 /DNA_ORIENTATION=-